MSGDLSKLRTWSGVPASDIAERLRAPFDDPRAYKAIHGGTAGAARLTDIDTAWMIERANEVFGPYGLGWSLDWASADVVIVSDDTRRQTAVLKRAEFRYVLIDEFGVERKCVAPCCGGSQNELPFALKGMQTSCIGNALSKLRFQELVYKGLMGEAGSRAEARGGERRPSPGPTTESMGTARAGVQAAQGPDGKKGAARSADPA